MTYLHNNFFTIIFVSVINQVKKYIMSINTILVHTQYEENYAHYEGGFHWKKKGGHTFQIEMDADILMYTDPAEIFGRMLLNHSNDIERFTYLEYEVQWQTPTPLGTQEDYINYINQLKGVESEKE